MTAVVIVGAQWGDEGKGKIVDMIAEQANMVVRYAGGANAGHTLMVNGQKLVTHLLPSGVLHPSVTCVLGAGMVIDPKVLLDEIDTVEARGLTLRDRLIVSHRAHVTFPFQSAIDKASNSGPHAIGTTGRGIGPTYSDKAARAGVRLAEFCNEKLLRNAIEALIDRWNERARALGVDGPSLDDAMAWARPLADRLRGYLGDCSLTVHQALKSRQRVVFEGAQGALLDLDHGSYPFVTSSNTIAGSACTGVGIGPTAIHQVIGITKAYCTRVGNGPFPSEIHGEEGGALREAGEEYGATTGRPRRCGWLDLPALRYAARINGLTSLAVTKLDILAGRQLIPVAVAHRVEGRVTTQLPLEDLDRAEPVLEMWPGWDASIAEARSWDALPAAAKRYIQAIENYIEVPVNIVSVGADRSATIVRTEVFAK